MPRDRAGPLHKGIPCLLLQNPKAAYLLLYFHANAEDLGRVRGLGKQLAASLGVHVLAVEYPGYGVCSGKPCEETLLDDADVVFNFVVDELQVPLQRLLIMGRSVGGGPAIFLASRYQCAGLVTVATFSSLRSVVASYVGWGGWFPDLFDNRTRIRSVSCRTLVIHGTHDETVDVEQAQELVQVCGMDVDLPPVELNLRYGVGHNNFDVFVDMVEPIQNAFPEIQSGRPLALQSAFLLLRRRTGKLASDVADRVPYPADYVPPGAYSDIFDS